MNVVRAIFRCKNCDWKTQDYRHGQRRAKSHAQTMGHEVSGEVTRFYEFKPLTARQASPRRRAAQEGKK